MEVGQYIGLKMMEHKEVIQGGLYLLALFGVTWIITSTLIKRFGNPLTWLINKFHNNGE